VGSALRFAGRAAAPVGNALVSGAKAIGPALSSGVRAAAPVIASGARTAGNALAAGARYAANVPAGQNFFSSPLAGAGRIAKLGLMPNLGKPLNLARIPVTGYTAYGLNEGRKFVSDADADLRSRAGHAVNTATGLRDAVAKSDPSNPSPAAATQAWNQATGNVGVARDMLQAAKDKGLAGLASTYASRRNELSPQTRAITDSTAAAMGKDTAQSAGNWIRDTPAWHQTALAATSPLQWLLRKSFLPKQPALKSYGDRAQEMVSALGRNEAQAIPVALRGTESRLPVTYNP
jgi:hypothetical protein